MPDTTFTFEVDPIKAEEISKLLVGASFELRTSPGLVWRARKKATTATYYNSGKLVVQGALARDLVQWLSKKDVLPRFGKERGPCRIGSDEAGKGDYFGPLVTAAVLVSRESEQTLLLSGVRDSKSISDETIRRLKPRIEVACPAATVPIGPKRYNELQNKLRTVNKVLGWAHARAIENILESHNCGLAVADQFGDQSYIKSALLERGKGIELFQMTHGERDLAVAAASVVARAEFLKRLEMMSFKFSMSFPKGASSEVISVAKEFVRRFGAARLGEVAKLHFRTTKEVLTS